MTTPLAPLGVVYACVFLLAELFLITQNAGFFLTIWRVARGARAAARPAPEPPALVPGAYPRVAVLVVARHEPRDVLEPTVTTLRNLNYPAKDLFFLDDSTEERYIKEADELAVEYSLSVFRREKRHGAKAGIINDFLKTIDHPYVAIFDADQNPMPDFLLRVVPILEQREKLAFVQTPQFYTNLDVGPVAKAAGMQQAIFYEIICEAKGSNRSMFCCGTNVVFRRRALDEIGGFDEESVTEDFSTSLKLQYHGWDSYYYNHAEVFGMGPETLPVYFKQQMRWAAGTTNVFKKIPGYFVRGPKKLSFTQWREYFLSSSYYFIGLALFILMLSPIVNLLFDVTPFVGNVSLYLLTFLPYFFITQFLFILTMMDRKYSFSQIYHGVILTFLSVPIQMAAAVRGLFSKKKIFAITTKGKNVTLPFPMLIPYIAFMALSVVALAKGIVMYFVLHDHALVMNDVWVVHNLFICLNIFYFNKKIKLPQTAEEKTNGDPGRGD
ncbi:MAG: glycosyltransferase [Spirochaetales bacterium]|nr:glycosyltransferase [Spirochaetales bacterium]